jgi:hypothetical protein
MTFEGLDKTMAGRGGIGGEMTRGEAIDGAFSSGINASRERRGSFALVRSSNTKLSRLTTCKGRVLSVCFCIDGPGGKFRLLPCESVKSERKLGTCRHA